MSGAHEIRFSNGMYCKKYLVTEIELNSSDSKASFLMFLWCPFATLSMSFGVMEPGVQCHGFSGLPGGTPELRKCTSGTLTGRVLGP